jgi:hypothetical protein
MVGNNDPNIISHIHNSPVKLKLEVRGQTNSLQAYYGIKYVPS